MKKFDHIIIWGHKLHSHTHSYIHNAFYKAFKAMGYDVHWFDDNDGMQDCDFPNSLFITEGQVCKNMPLIKGNKYVLHNCYDEKLWHIINAENIDYLKLQVYTDDVLKYNLKQLDNICTFYDEPGKMLYMPWATDLLPEEIKPFDLIERTNKSWWVGTMGDGVFGNIKELNKFIKSCNKNRIEFQHANNLSIEENRQKIAESYMAPAIVGTWQKEKNYIPCRIFKNVSYGQYGITNSKKVFELFDQQIIYSSDESKLFDLMVEKIQSPTYLHDLSNIISFVKEEHTYINRINTIISLL